MKLLVDMNLSPRWIRFLSEAGFEAIHWSEIGPAHAQDTEIMAYAAANSATVLTHDLDFSAILAATQGRKPSIVLIRALDVRPETVGRAVVDALRQMANELEHGALLAVEPSRIRLRLLPLRVDQ